MADNGLVPLNVINYESLTVSTTAVGITAANLLSSDAGSPPTAARVRCESQPVRFRIDGTDPTSTVGELLENNDSLIIYGTGNLAKLRFIREGAADATVSIHLMR